MYLCLLFILNHCFGNWVIGSSFCLFFGLLPLLLRLLSLGKVFASSTTEDSSKEPKNGSSDGTIATNADATTAGTYARLKDQENKGLENARSDAKQAYEAEGILSEAAAAGEDVEEPDAESKGETGRADSSRSLQFLVARYTFDAPVYPATFLFVAP